MDQDLQAVTVQAVNDAVGTQIDRVHYFAKSYDKKTADAILAEWVDADGDCLLLSAVKGDTKQYTFFYASDDFKETGDLVIFNDDEDDE